MAAHCCLKKSIFIWEVQCRRRSWRHWLADLNSKFSFSSAIFDSPRYRDLLRHHQHHATKSVPLTVQNAIGLFIDHNWATLAILGRHILPMTSAVISGNFSPTYCAMMQLFSFTGDAAPADGTNDRWRHSCGTAPESPSAAQYILIYTKGKVLGLFLVYF